MSKIRLSKFSLSRATATGLISCMAMAPALAARADCGGDPVYPPPAPSPVRVGDSTYTADCAATRGTTLLSVKPSHIDARLRNLQRDDLTNIYSTYDECHIYTLPANFQKDSNTNDNENDKLFVFIDGTHTHTASYQKILNAAREHNYYAVSISYPNDQGIDTYCNPNNQAAYKTDADCAGKMRQEIVVGHGRSSDPNISDGATVNTPNSIINRLTDFLKYVGWTQFLKNAQTEIDWSNVTVAGHSQGSGNALYIAKYHVVDHVMIFSGVDDRNPLVETDPAPWLTDGNWATPAGSISAMVHVDDGIANAETDKNGHVHGSIMPCEDSPSSDEPYYIDTCHSAYQSWLAVGIHGPAYAQSNFETVYDRPASMAVPVCSQQKPNLAAALPNHLSTVEDAYVPSTFRAVWDRLAFTR